MRATASAVSSVFTGSKQEMIYRSKRQAARASLAFAIGCPRRLMTIAADPQYHPSQRVFSIQSPMRFVQGQNRWRTESIHRRGFHRIGDCVREFVGRA